MPRPKNVTNFLNTLDNKVQETNTEKLQERANKAVAKLGDSDLQYLIDDRRSLLDEAVRANNIYFVNALLKKKQFFINKSPSNYINVFNNETLQIIKALKSAGFDVNTQTLDHSFNLSDVFLQAKKSASEVAMIIELLPKQLTEKDCDQFTKLSETDFIKIYEQRKEIFTDQALKSIYCYAVRINNLNLLNAKLFKVLSETFTPKESERALLNLTIYYTGSTTRLQNTHFIDLVKTHFNQLLISTKTSMEQNSNHSLLNMVLCNLMHGIQNLFEKSDDAKTENVAAESLKVVYELLALIEEHPEKLNASFVNFGMFFKMVADSIIAEQKKQSEILLSLITNNDFSLTHSHSVTLNLANKTNNDSSLTNKVNKLTAYFAHKAKTKKTAALTSLILAHQYSHFFLQQLLRFAPELLVELMHVENDEFNIYLYDRLNKIASELGIKQPIVFSALHAMKMLALHEDASLTEQAKNPFLADPTKQLPHDISKVIVTYLTDLPRSQINFALSTQATRLKFFLKNEPDATLRAKKESIDVKNAWTSYRQFIVDRHNNLRYLLQQFNLSSRKIYLLSSELSKIKQGHFNNDPSGLTIAEKQNKLTLALQNDIQTAKNEMIQFTKQMDVELSLLMTSKERFGKLYLSSYLKPEEQKQFFNHTMKNNLVGFNALFKMKQDTLPLLKEPNKNNEGEPPLKIQRIETRKI